MRVTTTPLPGVIVIEPDIHGDARGFFVETFQAERYRQQAGIDAAFVQDNHSRSRRGVLRGLHGQRQRPQGKLIRVSRGTVFDVAVDGNPASATFGQWFGVELTDDNHRQLYIPPGYLHGFVVLSEVADFEYKCTDYYDPADEIGLLWNDPDLNIDWPVSQPLVSEKDQRWPTVKTLRDAGV